MFLRNGLVMAVIELTLLVNMQPAARLVVLVALDIAGLPLPLLTRGIIRQRIVERCIMPLVDFRGRLHLVGCRMVGFLLELPSLLFGGQFFGVRHGLLFRLGLVSLRFSVQSCNLDSGGFADVGTETFGERCCVVRVDSRIFAIVPANRFCMAVSPLSKGEPPLCA